MPIQTVFLKSDAYLTCLSHALSTEKEEIMGLLLGHVENVNSSSRKTVLGKSYIENVVILQRSVRQADRVEISPLQLTAAAQEAEKLSEKQGKPVRVLGWYHSHPHITVQPSHVDVGTQANYQAMDPDFIGLIFSVFQQQANEKFANASVICFQAVNDDDGILSSKEIPITIIHDQTATAEQNLKILAEIPQILYHEEKKEMKEICKTTNTISKLNNSAVFTQALCHLVEFCEMPSISAVIAYEQSLLYQLHCLKLIRKNLQKK